MDPLAILCGSDQFSDDDDIFDINPNKKRPDAEVQSNSHREEISISGITGGSMTEVYSQPKRRKLDHIIRKDTAETFKNSVIGSALPCNAEEIKQQKLRWQKQKMREIANQAKDSSKSATKKSELRRENFQKILKADKEDLIKTNKKGKLKKTVVDKMELTEENGSPLVVLFECMKFGIKAKVWIRRYNGLRGIVTGYIAAFDLHMNLAMVDVDEIYTIESWMVGQPLSKSSKKRYRNKQKKREEESTDQGYTILPNVYYKPDHLKNTDVKKRALQNDNPCETVAVQDRSAATTNHKPTVPSAPQNQTSLKDFLKKLTKNMKTHHEPVKIQRDPCFKMKVGSSSMRASGFDEQNLLICQTEDNRQQTNLNPHEPASLVSSEIMNILNRPNKATSFLADLIRKKEAKVPNSLNDGEGNYGSLAPDTQHSLLSSSSLPQSSIDSIPSLPSLNQSSISATSNPSTNTTAVLINYTQYDCDKVNHFKHNESIKGISISGEGNESRVDLNTNTSRPVTVYEQRMKVKEKQRGDENLTEHKNAVPVRRTAEFERADKTEEFSSRTNLFVPLTLSADLPNLKRDEFSPTANCNDSRSNRNLSLPCPSYSATTDRERNKPPSDPRLQRLGINTQKAKFETSDFDSTAIQFEKTNVVHSKTDSRKSEKKLDSTVLFENIIVIGAEKDSGHAVERNESQTEERSTSTFSTLSECSDIGTETKVNQCQVVTKKVGDNVNLLEVIKTDNRIQQNVPQYPEKHQNENLTVAIPTSSSPSKQNTTNFDHKAIETADKNPSNKKSKKRKKLTSKAIEKILDSVHNKSAKETEISETKTGANSSETAHVITSKTTVENTLDVTVTSAVKSCLGPLPNPVSVGQQDFDLQRVDDRECGFSQEKDVQSNRRGNNDIVKPNRDETQDGVTVLSCDSMIIIHDHNKVLSDINISDSTGVHSKIKKVYNRDAECVVGQTTVDETKVKIAHTYAKGDKSMGNKDAMVDVDKSEFVKKVILTPHSYTPQRDLWDDVMTTSTARTKHNNKLEEKREDEVRHDLSLCGNKVLSSVPENELLSPTGNNRCAFVYHSIAKRLNSMRSSRSLPRIEWKILKSTVKKITPMFETGSLRSELSTDEESIGDISNTRSLADSIEPTIFPFSREESLSEFTTEDQRKHKKNKKKKKPRKDVDEKTYGKKYLPPSLRGGLDSCDIETQRETSSSPKNLSSDVELGSTSRKHESGVKYFDRSRDKSIEKNGGDKVKRGCSTGVTNDDYEIIRSSDADTCSKEYRKRSKHGKDKKKEKGNHSTNRTCDNDSLRCKDSNKNENIPSERDFLGIRENKHSSNAESAEKEDNHHKRYREKQTVEIKTRTKGTTKSDRAEINSEIERDRFIGKYSNDDKLNESKRDRSKFTNKDEFESLQSVVTIPTKTYDELNERREICGEELSCGANGNTTLNSSCVKEPIKKKSSDNLVLTDLVGVQSCSAGCNDVKLDGVQWSLSDQQLSKTSLSTKQTKKVDEHGNIVLEPANIDGFTAEIKTNKEIRLTSGATDQNQCDAGTVISQTSQALNSMKDNVFKMKSNAIVDALYNNVPEMLVEKNVTRANTERLVSVELNEPSSKNQNKEKVIKAIDFDTYDIPECVPGTTEGSTNTETVFNDVEEKNLMMESKEKDYKKITFDGCVAIEIDALPSDKEKHSQVNLGGLEGEITDKENENFCDSSSNFKPDVKMIMHLSEAKDGKISGIVQDTKAVNQIMSSERYEEVQSELYGEPKERSVERFVIEENDMEEGEIPSEDEKEVPADTENKPFLKQNQEKKVRNKERKLSSDERRLANREERDERRKERESKSLTSGRKERCGNFRDVRDEKKTKRDARDASSEREKVRVDKESREKGDKKRSRLERKGDRVKGKDNGNDRRQCEEYAAKDSLKKRERRGKQSNKYERKDNRDQEFSGEKEKRERLSDKGKADDKDQRKTKDDHSRKTQSVKSMAKYLPPSMRGELCPEEAEKIKKQAHLLETNSSRQVSSSKNEPVSSNRNNSNLRQKDISVKLKTRRESSLDTNSLAQKKISKKSTVGYSPNNNSALEEERSGRVTKDSIHKNYNQETLLTKSSLKKDVSLKNFDGVAVREASEVVSLSSLFNEGVKQSNPGFTIEKKGEKIKGNASNDSEKILVCEENEMKMSVPRISKINKHESEWKERSDLETENAKAEDVLKEKKRQLQVDKDAILMYELKWGKDCGVMEENDPSTDSSISEGKSFYESKVNTTATDEMLRDASQGDLTLNVFQQRKYSKAAKRTVDGRTKKEDKILKKTTKYKQAEKAETAEVKVLDSFVERRIKLLLGKEELIKQEGEKRRFQAHSFDEELLRKLRGKTFEPSKPQRGLIFKKRHLNQLFIRGDNIVLVAYEKPKDIESVRFEESSYKSNNRK